jgi:hypothetical protein
MNDVSEIVSDDDIAVILDEQPGYIKRQTSLIWSRTGSLLRVYVISTFGQDPANIRFSVLLSNPDLEVLNGYYISDSVALNSVTYYDENGVVMSGPVPQVIVQ